MRVGWFFLFILVFLGFGAWVVQPSPRSASFEHVIFHHCYDGDTCTVSLPGMPPLFGDHISVRLTGIDAPERKAKCAREAQLADEARVMVNRILDQASRIDLVDPQRDKYFRINARMIADGQDVGQVLVEAGLAVLYNGGTKSAGWCS